MRARAAAVDGERPVELLERLLELAIGEKAPPFGNMVIGVGDEFDVQDRLADDVPEHQAERAEPPERRHLGGGDDVEGHLGELLAAELDADPRVLAFRHQVARLLANLAERRLESPAQVDRHPLGGLLGAARGRAGLIGEIAQLLRGPVVDLGPVGRRGSAVLLRFRRGRPLFARSAPGLDLVDLARLLLRPALAFRHFFPSRDQEYARRHQGAPLTIFSDSLRAFLKPVVPFLDDAEVSEVLINGPKEVFVERRGKLERTSAVFTDDGLLAAARNMAQFVGRPLSEERPRLDARLPDGSRIHVVLAPIARNGTTVAIRKFSPDKLTVKDMVARGSMTPEVARFLETAVRAKLNIVVAGGTGSGKTSLLNALATFIPEDERILTIEDSAELQLRKPHVVAFESRPPDRNGKGAIDMGELLHSALRLRPDRIVVGEVRGGECFHLLQAMNTGHGGSLATVHANSPIDTLHRLESLCLLSGVELPLIAVRAQVASAINLVICCARLADGSRKVTDVAEVLPLDERGEHRVQELWKFTSQGGLSATGARARVQSKLDAVAFSDGENTQRAQHPLGTASGG